MDIQAALDLADALVRGKTGDPLSDLQREILRASWSWEHCSYDQIAEAYGYSANYLKKHVGPGLWKLLSEILQEKVSKTNARSAFERRLRSHLPQPETSPQPPVVQPAETAIALTPAFPPTSPTPPLAMPSIDWGEAIALEVFYGRQSELHRLDQWIVHDRCRL
ncbi:MAG TPA: hypothetical protein V6C57_08095, partial [Coleofasciculaceae cyanobacterium]